MRWRFISWYRRPMTPSEVSDQLVWFERSGLTLINPMTEVITALDEIGDQVVTDQESLTRQLAHEKETTFQFWLDESAGVTCSFSRPSEQLLAQYYYLDGLDLEQRELVESLLWDSFRLEMSRSLALVVDTFGATEDFDWDEAITAGEVPLDVVPELLVVRRKDAHQPRNGEFSAFELRLGDRKQ